MSDSKVDRQYRLFILVRRDLRRGQQAVQACHALSDLMFKHGADPQLQAWVEQHKTLIILGVDDLDQLLRWEQKLSDSHLKYETFVEPDMRDEKTAIAVHPTADPYLFRKLWLL